jgi:hypothetical protein
VALESMSTDDLKKEMNRIVDGAQAVWDDFEKRAERNEKPSARAVASAVLAADHLLRAEMMSIWANVGIAVQESRTAIVAVGELGRGLLSLVKELERRQHELSDALATAHVLPEQACHWTPLDTAALDAALGKTAPRPEELPEGSTRTDPVAPTPKTT